MLREQIETKIETKMRCLPWHGLFNPGGQKTIRHGELAGDEFDHKWSKYVFLILIMPSKKSSESLGTTNTGTGSKWLVSKHRV